MKIAKEMLEWYKSNRKVRRFKITDSMYMKYFKEIEKIWIMMKKYILHL